MRADSQRKAAVIAQSAIKVGRATAAGVVRPFWTPV